MNSNLDIIKNADRNPIPNIQNAVAELNGFSKKLDNAGVSVQWLQGLDEMGPCLHGIVKFNKINDCLNFAKNVYDLQEKVDHHTNFVINNFTNIDVKISTHHPVPAVTQVDFLFAKQLISILEAQF